MHRYIQQPILSDLKKKMVFIGGPRQVGKTTLSKTILKQPSFAGEYFNWDIDEDRLAIQQKHWLDTSSLIVFDELHKYPRWKQWIKGVYDSRPPNQQYLVTGSARLDVYKRGGDSLLGRYHYWRLHPFTLDEYPTTECNLTECYQRLLSVGGFPEPFLLNDEREVRRWRRERFDRIIKEDIRDVDNIRNTQLLFLFVNELRQRVGGLITLANIARDLEISPTTAKHWLMLIERMYIAFSIYPLTKNIPRAILKPPKVYFFDNGDVINDEGARLENLIATTLLKRLHFLEDYHGYRCELHYIRDKDGREIDFAVVINDQIKQLIEVKRSDTTPSTALRYYADKLQVASAIQIVGNLQRPFHHDGILVTNPIQYCSDFSYSRPPDWIK
jgi:predicted AAA+ superfamily ATPase